MRSKKFRLPRKKIAEFCKRWSINEFSVFGSVLRDDFRPDSDIDVLVSIDPRAHIGLFEIAQMQIELEDIKRDFATRIAEVRYYAPRRWFMALDKR
jgi:predicted nucleotidyltransferase